MKKELAGAAIWAGLMLVLAFGSVSAHRLGYIDRDMVTRLVTGAMGLWMVWYGNRIPKTFTSNPCARRAQRVAAWSTILSGLAYAGLWAFAPIQAAVVYGTLAVFAGLAVTLGYCLMLRGRAKAA